MTAAEVYRWQRPRVDNSTFELDFKQVSNSYFWPDSRYLKDPKRQNMSFIIARNPQNCPSSQKKIIFGGINSVYKTVGSIIDRTSCTCKASTKWKCSKVVYSIWVGQSEFSKGWSDCYILRSRGGRHPNLIIVYSSQAHTGHNEIKKQVCLN